jgi:hypothetical protein
MSGATAEDSGRSLMRELALYATNENYSRLATNTGIAAIPTRNNSRTHMYRQRSRSGSALGHYFVSLSSSVRYLGAASITFLMKAASCAASTLGGGVVRVATGIPISLKNCSWPAGEQMQSILTGDDEALWNW